MTELKFIKIILGLIIKDLFKIKSLLFLTFILMTSFLILYAVSVESITHFIGALSFVFFVLIPSISIVFCWFLPNKLEMAVKLIQSK